MDMFKNKLVNVNGVAASKEIPVKKIWRLAKLKAAITVKNIKHFLLSKKWQPLWNLGRQQGKGVNNNIKTLSGKFLQPKMPPDFDIREYSKSASAVNIIDNEKNKPIDHLGNISNMSSAQNVYKVILMQQIEWMDGHSKNA